MRRSGHVDWVEVSTRGGASDATTGFLRGDEAWFADRCLFFTTTADHRVWAMDVETNEIEVLYDGKELGVDAPLRDPDSITVHERSGDILVAEHGEDGLQLLLLADARRRRVAPLPFLQLIGHHSSEITGTAFSPDGMRLYFSSQQGTDGCRADLRGDRSVPQGPLSRVRSGAH